MKTLLLAAAMSAAIAAPASAATVLYDNFAGENGGVTQTNYTGLANFDISAGTFGNTNPAIDLIASGAYGINCMSSGMCVDLDGSTGQGGQLTTKSMYSFNAGDRVTLTINVSGNQRGSGPDGLSFGFNTSGGTLFNDITEYNTFVTDGTAPVGDLGPGAFLGSGRPIGMRGGIASNEAFDTYSISFTAGNAGMLNAFVATDSNDNIGPILGDFKLEITPSAVPEPASWAMMIGGIGLAGGAMRRQRTTRVKAAIA
jgi:hypothetical protein